MPALVSNKVITAHRLRLSRACTISKAAIRKVATSKAPLTDHPEVTTTADTDLADKATQR